MVARARGHIPTYGGSMSHGYSNLYLNCTKKSPLFPWPKRSDTPKADDSKRFETLRFSSRYPSKDCWVAAFQVAICELFQSQSGFHQPNWRFLLCQSKLGNVGMTILNRKRHHLHMDCPRDTVTCDVSLRGGTTGSDVSGDH